MDIDNIVGCWIKDVPYFYLDGNEYTARRYYFSSGDAVHYVKVRGKLMPMTFNEIVQRTQATIIKPDTPIYYFYTQAKNCENVMNFFNVYNTYFITELDKNALKNIPVRVNGLDVSAQDYLKISAEGTIELKKPTTTTQLLVARGHPTLLIKNLLSYHLSRDTYFRKLFSGPTKQFVYLSYYANTNVMPILQDFYTTVDFYTQPGYMPDFQFDAIKKSFLHR